jgi:CubicO group peptidase (beta-lactamase class C family)
MTSIRGTGVAGDVTIGDAPQAIYQIASVSKQFVAAAVLMLAEERQLDLHRPVEHWFPGAHPQWRAVTLHHLLTHNAGFPHWDFKTPCLDPHASLGHDERITLLQRTPLVAEPGGAWAYTSPAYLLVGAIIERAAGVTFADFATERIVRPLGLTDTHIGYRPDDASAGHLNGEPAREIQAEQMVGTGSMWCSAADLVTLITALHSGVLLSESALRLLQAPHVPAEGQSYGYGVYIGQRSGEEAYWHMGDLPGHKSFGAWLPRRGVAVVVLSNEESTDVKAVADELIAQSAA